ncbi:AraC family transcriptional regulator of adaptative response/methylated-DNA-[protein]-cysteine methyltransferase [Varunaivibrio sulfuroxidans]|uniref:methylated-DNA--[protein]-cysteine S-methyltransferase n=2 Tax=Varunaivibrio sulfuroxidans TaxID=1773489 RepID=A0A4R3J6P5_9PROT|nr:AraC family transcriptional regulator of adaptative response/methylated-DNA-[protein]-cysteine methyltransferase [Varunaivibrio sulfuroxidans]
MVCARDGAQNGTFVYAVITTGVYCAPGCPSRRAKRENVRFFKTPREAESAGFRSCKRCRPERPSTPSHSDAIRRACQAIEGSEEEPTLEALARDAGLSPGYFQRIFKAHVGLSPKRYAMALRKRRLRGALEQARSVTGAIYDAGYANSSRAYADNDSLGLTPGAYRKGAKGEVVRFASAQSSLGEIFVAATARGVCMVEFATHDVGVEKLKARFPHAQCAPGDAALSDWVALVVALIDTPGQNIALPLDIRGTAFQERVWQALGRIPCGQTVSYSRLATMIGQPTAARAVARACATNAIAVAVPCHRIVRGSGALGGYRWGLERKRALIEREAAIRTGKPDDSGGRD